MNKNSFKIIMLLPLIVVFVITMIWSRYVATCFCMAAFLIYVLVWLYQSHIKLKALQASLLDYQNTSYWREITGPKQPLYQSRLAELVTKYGFSFDFYLLSLDEALAFVDDLEKAGIAVDGVDGWYGDETSEKSMYYDPDFEMDNFAFSDEARAKTLSGEDVVAESIEEIRQMLMQQGPPIKYVRIWLHVPYTSWKESMNKEEGRS